MPDAFAFDPIATPANAPALLPVPQPEQDNSFDPIDPDQQQAAFVPAVVRDSLFKDQVMDQVKALPADQAFDTAVALNKGDLKWPLTAFKGVNPDVAARVDQLAKENGTTFDSAKVGKEDLELIDQAKQIVSKLNEIDDAGNPMYPSTSRYIKDPLNLAKSHDDIDALANIEQVIRQRQQMGETWTRQTLRALQAGGQRIDAGVLSAPANIADLIRGFVNTEGGTTRSINSGPVLTPKNAPAEPPETPLPKWLSEAGGLIPSLEKRAAAGDAVTIEGRDFLGDLLSGNFSGAVQTGLLGVESTVPTLIAALANPELGIILGSTISGGSQYRADILAGKKPSMAAVDGYFNALAEGGGEGIGGTVSQFKRVQRLFANAPAAQSLPATLGRLVRQSVVSGVQGGLSEGATQLAQDVSDYATGNPGALDNEVHNVLNAALLGAFTDSTMTTTVGALDGYLKLQEQKRGQEYWDELTKTTAKSKLRQRDPEGFAAHVTQTLVAANQPTTVGVDGDKVTTFFQDDAPGLEQFSKDMGIPVADIQAAAKTGSELPLPIGPYTAKYAGSSLDAAIQQDLRFTPGGLSANEVKAETERVKAMAAAIQTELAKIPSGETKLPEQIKTIRETLMKPKAEGGAGYSSEQADAQLSVLLAGLKTLAAHRGETVEQAVNRLGLGLQVGGAGIVAAPASPRVKTVYERTEKPGSRVTDANGKRGEIVSEGKDGVTIEWNDGTTETRPSLDGLKRSLSSTTVTKNAVIISPGVGNTSFGVSYFDAEGKETYEAFKFGGSYGTFEEARERARARAKQLVEEHNLEGHVEDIKVRDEGDTEGFKPASETRFQSEPIASPTETPAFKNWFGDSKVVGENGQPKVMYHGTSQGDFEAFDPQGSNHGLYGTGSYFTDNLEIAKTYAYKGHGAKNVVYPVYLSIKNPMDMEAKADLSKWGETSAFKEYGGDVTEGMTNAQVYKSIERNISDEGDIPDYEGGEMLWSAISAQGHDGITHIGGGKHRKSDGTKHQVYIAFEPEQIKSAIGNIGTFDPKNPSIRHQSNRGAVQFADGRTTIHLFETADLSTFLHETAHIFLYEMQNLVESGIATPEVAADLKTLTDFAGGTDVKSEEKIVRAFEAYLRDGKAPSVQLASAFARFRQWLTAIYRHISALGGKPSEEVRNVFDRLLASEEDIADAEDYYNRKAEIIDLIAADDAEKAKLKEKLATVNASALDHQTAAYLKSYLKAIGGVSSVRDAAKAEVEASPIYQAIETAKNGKIDSASLENALGKKGLGEFKAKYPSLVKDGGDNTLESLAAEHGFESPETLADVLLSAVPKAEAIKNYTKRLIAEKEQELRDEIVKRGASPADGIMHSDGSLAYLIAETQLMARQLEKAGGTRIRITENIYRDAAIQALAGMPVKRAVRYDLFAKAESRLARQVLQFAKQGKWKEALEARNKQLAQHALVQEAIKARDTRDAIERRYAHNKLEASLKGVENQFIDPIREILAAYNLTDTGPSKPYDLKELADIDPVLFGLLPTWLINRENAGDYRNLTWGQLQDVDNAVRSIIQFGRDQMKSLKEGEEKTLTEFVEKSIARMVQLKDASVAQRGDKFKYGLDIWDWLKSHTAMTQFTSEIADNFGYEREGKAGPLRRLYQKLVSSELAQRQLQQQVLKLSEPHWKVLRTAAERIQDENGKYFDIPELPLPRAMAKAGRANWTAEQLVAFMLNTGNEGNLTALKNAYLYTDKEVQKVASYFTAEELRAIQGIWDATETLFDPLDAAHFDVYNRHVPKVSASPVSLYDKEGKPVTLKGGYYPLVFDHEINDRAAKYQEEDLLQNQQKAIFRASKPEDGMVMARSVGHSLPPFLNLDVWAKHIDDTTRYINFAAVVRDWNRVTKNEAWKAAFTDKFGNRQYRVLRDWLQYQAVPRRHPQSEVMRGVDSVADWIRARSTYAILGLKLRTGLMQRTALINSAYALGGWKWIGEGYKFLGTRGLGTSTLGWGNNESWNKIQELSPYMSSREDVIDREIRDAVEHIKPGAKSYSVPGTNKTFTAQDVRDFTFQWIKMNDRSVVSVVWAGAFQKYLQTMSDPHKSMEDTTKEAAAYADQMVQETQPSSLKSELSSMQRAEGWVRFFTAFMSWSFKYGNRLLYNAKAWKEGAIPTKQYVNHLVHEVFAEPWLRVLLYSALAGTAPNWWDFPLKTIDTLLSWIPGLSNLTSMAQYGFSADSLSPTYEPLKRAERVRADIAGGIKSADKFAWDLARLTEFFVGVPALNVVKDILDINAKVKGEKQPYK